MTLVVGCGQKPKPGCWNLDYVMPPITCSDLGLGFVLHDLNDLEPSSVITGLPSKRLKRMPFPDKGFSMIEAEDVLEHVDHPILVVQELGRLLEVGGTLWIRGPDGRYPEIVWADLTHKRAFSHRTFDGFDPETYDGIHYGHYHGKIKFKVESVIENNKGLEFVLTRRADT